MAENIEQKGRRYLTEGRVTVTHLDGDIVTAEARGGDAMYSLGFDTVRRNWYCTCLARGRCAHLVALQLVVLRPADPAGERGAVEAGAEKAA